ncbi:D-lyxose/D-mannose family sugar isomerase [Roseitranquillus sediminis]|uniref:D-lyxose/D-mannose family sugar isomerase n=1 Tax=Roseitranquillus sediminis TaxID=2809051 RepID=UPI001D0CD1C3|nr:D-lyxose/D-mannose family sugar isomerase [Roseitranquillus sediminis]MBM9596218.1 D-lyxose/D-mannose family sugar isomerase [Roseitranquillus sediminis]
MKRSDVNDIIAASEAFMRSFGYALPPFAYWSPERIGGAEAATIRERGMGWDITDFGKGRFDELGLILFTTRNGSLADLSSGRGMLYAEKIMISRERQMTPMHRHDLKAEDIINRGGGDLVIELFASDAQGGIDRQADVTVPCDGVERTLTPGAHLRIAPGESVTLMPGVWHSFWAEGGDCLIGEVSTVNDDKTDNIFADPVGRFSQIDEDAAPTHLLVSDY